jgi:hypothetical protein
MVNKKQQNKHAKYDLNVEQTPKIKEKINKKVENNNKFDVFEFKDEIIESSSSSSSSTTTPETTVVLNSNQSNIPRLTIKMRHDPILEKRLAKYKSSFVNFKLQGETLSTVKRKKKIK